MSVPIRLAKADDAPALAALASELGYPSNPVELKARLPDLLDSDEHGVFVACDDAGVVGCLHAARRCQLEADPFVEIVAMVVSERRQSAGIGASLLERAEAWAAEKGVGLIRVRSNVIRERAHRFYERLGYERVKTSHLFVRAVCPKSCR